MFSKTRFSSSDDDLLTDFYIPALNQAQRYDRAVGYFSGALLAVTGLAFVDFAERGAKMRLVCSPRLSDHDAEALRRSHTMPEQVAHSILDDIAQLRQNPLGRATSSLLAALLRIETIDLRLALGRHTNSLFHDKVGLFDLTSGEIITFVGSSNETLMAWAPERNHESFEVFSSWQPGRDRMRVQEHAKYFQRLWLDELPNVSTKALSEAVRDELIESYGMVNPGEAADDVREAMADKPRGSPQPSPRSRPQLMPHQLHTIASWKAADYRGIVKHATGAGKTITALEAVRFWVDHGLPALIIVPSTLLLEQWMNQVTDFFPDGGIAIAAVGGAHDDSVVLRDFTLPDETLGPRCVIATLQTAFRGAFRNKVSGGPHLLMVVDEVHRAGSSAYRRALTIETGASLGLSATPERYGDEEGTRKLFEVLGPVLEPVIDIPDAISMGRLVPYDYHVATVNLTEDERERYDQLTQKLVRAFGTEADPMSLPQWAMTLLIKRARIVKRAAEKLPTAASMLQKASQRSSHVLAYCDHHDDVKELAHELQARGVDATEYYAAMPADRDSTLQHFRRRGGVLVSIRCLDEGIDIPEVSEAIFLASSRNPREFIQRRGRVLRSSPGKHHAEIRDVLVVPDPPMNSPGLMLRELERAELFAKDAQNRSVLHDLRAIRAMLPRDGFEVEQEEIESDEPS